MIEIFASEFMQRALLAGLMISVVTSVLGVFLVLKKLSLIGDGLAHASFGGVAVGFLLNINPFLTALVVAALGSVGIHRLMEKARTYGDSAIALILSAGMALAVVIIGYTGGFQADLFSYLFGSILTVSNTDLLIIGTVFVATLAYVGLFYRELVYTSFNTELARLHSNKTRLAENLFIILIALAVVISIRAVGILLVTALIVIPALTALHLAESFKNSLIISVFVSLISMFLGITLAYVLNLPPSGVIVVMLLGFFLMAYGVDELL